MKDTFRSPIAALFWLWERSGTAPVGSYAPRLSEGGSSYTSRAEDDMALAVDIGRCLDALPEVERIAIVLSYRARLSDEEISRKLRRLTGKRWPGRRIGEMIAEGIVDLEERMRSMGLLDHAE